MSAPRRPRLLLLDDTEHLVRTAPGFARIAGLADTTALDVPLAQVPDSELRDVRVLLAIRERTRLDRATLDRLPNLELVLQTGGHAYHVDAAAAAERGITVVLWRRHRAVQAAMVELVFGLAIAALRQFPEAVRAGDDGGWPRLTGATLWGRRLGVLGMGPHGREVARLGRAFGMEVVAWARPGSPPPTDDVPRLGLDELLATSDVVTVHLRLSEESRGLLGERELPLMKPGAVLVNTARGAIVDEVALYRVLVEGPLRAAGLDVYVEEPLPTASPLRTLPNVMLTPHVGWTVQEVFAEFADGAADQLVDYLRHDLDPAELAFPSEAGVVVHPVGGLRT